MHKRLSVPFNIMKLAKLAYLPAIGLALSLTVVGCKKGLDNTTQIPGQKPGAPTESATGPRDRSRTGLLASADPASSELPNRETLRKRIQQKGMAYRWNGCEAFAAQTVHFVTTRRTSSRAKSAWKKSPGV
jgi:hypothetical protein